MKLAKVWVDRVVVMYTFSLYIIGFNVVRMLDETIAKNAFAREVFYTFRECKRMLHKDIV